VKKYQLSIINCQLSIAIVIALMTMTAACTSNSDAEQVEMTISATVGIDDETRAGQVLPGGYFDSGTQVGVFVTGQGNTADIKQNNVVYTSSGEMTAQKWIAPSRLVLTDQPWQAMAYFPYDGSPSFDVTNIPLTCPNDGTDIDNLYTSWKTNISKARPNVRFILQHIKAKIRVQTNVKFSTAYNEDVTHKPQWTAAAIEGTCYATSGHYNAQTGEIVTTGTNGLSSVIDEELTEAFGTHYAYTEWLVLPTASPGTLTIRLTIDGKPVKYSLDNIQLRSGLCTEVSLLLDEQSLRLSSQVLYADWESGGTTTTYDGDTGLMEPTNPNDN